MVLLGLRESSGDRRLYQFHQPKPTKFYHSQHSNHYYGLPVSVYCLCCVTKNTSMAVTLADSTSCNLLRNTDNIRNVCIMAHVDHGKTTFADALIASNGIISSRLAGKLRYMDSLKEEQERGITMKSSSISLYHKYEQDEYLINVIDSPGHVDFSVEISTAVRLCDSAIILVDVVEGVCPQTRAALRQAWAEKLKCLLVLNKLDRLILEKKMSPLNAYVHLSQILEQLNNIMGKLLRNDALEENEEANISSNQNTNFEELNDFQSYFNPEDNNVIFASAIDNWGFSIEDFAEILHLKHGFSKKVLQTTLWGNYYLDSKNKQVKKGAQEQAKKPLFVKLVLENIWMLYETILVRREKEKFSHIIKNLGINVKPQYLRLNDPAQTLRTILGSWIPLATVVLNTVCKILPPPNRLSEEKIDSLMFGSKRYCDPCEESINLRSAFSSCSPAAEAPIIVFISKMFSVESKHLPENRGVKATVRRDPAEVHEDEVVVEQDDEVFVAFARIYSGCIRTGSNVYVLGPKHDPRQALQKLKSGFHVDEKATLKDLKADEHITKVNIERLYLLMGRELEALNEVPAGNVFGIGGLEEHVLKHATLSTEIACPPFSDLYLMATPILRVAIEPQNPVDLKQLLHGLKLLNQADASVQVLVQETGEPILVTTGEVHLQRCIEDLRQRYAKVPVLVSEPIIPFRETVVPPPTVDMVKEAIAVESHDLEEKTTVSVSTLNNLCSVCIKAVPLPAAVTTLLENSTTLIKYLTTNAKKRNEKIVTEFKTKLTDAFGSSGLCVDKIWSFGPRTCGSNILFNDNSNSEVEFSFWKRPTTENTYTKYESSFLNGFQLATLAGPLCEEPMMGVGFVVSDWSISQDTHEYGLLSGQLMSAVKEGCRDAFQLQPQRLMAAMYTCNILVNSEVLGRMYALLNKRHGRILHGDLEASCETTFNITAYLPVAESFAFASEVRKQTSGLANPQLVFSHWEVIDLDPFWTPNTEDEYLLYGEKADSENHARTYMNQVRRRKGLPTDEKVVEHAEKQRTLSKKK